MSVCDACNCKNRDDKNSGYSGWVDLPWHLVLMWFTNCGRLVDLFSTNFLHSLPISDAKLAYLVLTSYIVYRFRTHS